MKAGFPRTAQEKTIRAIVFSRKAMNLGTIETVPSVDDCGLGGIGESIRKQIYVLLDSRVGARESSKTTHYLPRSVR